MLMTELLLLTIILECLALWMLGERTPLFYLYWIAVTTATNLSANLYIVYAFGGSDIEYYIAVAIIELLVFAVEFALCYIYTSQRKKSLIYSAVCNGASFVIGSLIQSLFLYIGGISDVFT